MLAFASWLTFFLATFVYLVLQWNWLLMLLAVSLIVCNIIAIYYLMKKKYFISDKESTSLAIEFFTVEFLSQVVRMFDRSKVRDLYDIIIILCMLTCLYLIFWWGIDKKRMQKKNDR